MEKTKYRKVFNALIPLFIGLPLIGLPFLLRGNDLPPEMREGMLKHEVLFNALLILIFYVHYYLIYPLKDRKHGAWIYSGLLLVCLLVFIGLNSLIMPLRPQFKDRPFVERDLKLERRGPRPGGSPRFWISIIPFAFVITVGFCYRLYNDKVVREELIKELENVNLKTELAFLSSQISPHFMFNVLNTLVSMARKKSELLEPSLISLSQLMRYMLYDHDGSRISLSNEIEYLKSYVNLQLLRFGDDIQVNLYLSGAFERYTIAPMLLIPFVENAFKHGIGTLTDPIIDIFVKMEEGEGRLHLMVINGISDGIPSLEKDSGIGLPNVCRRLELLYPDQHQIVIENNHKTFTVKLQIDL
ncbi:sensor histidine kinase [Pedobacter gandavensis]|uniref:Histidine kinase n=1 Tax=Pedobacter gandavensis TaxID=2679963 RepID=A0ABR6F1I6_9SPHI|nr:histidine kinase [Pedobacter gandavensis]MBB2150523.1 histidine kinase [Pedobacter gandavensis]